MRLHCVARDPTNRLSFIPSQPLARFMKNFFDNVLRYPRYFITFVLGIFFSIFEWVKPIVNDRTTATVLGVLLLCSLVFVTLTLRAMLGLAPL